MKKSLLALAVLGAYAGVASAQSSVTIFGVVDLSINQIKNGDAKTTSMASNQLNSNRLGFRGVEDLGGGLGAGFWLEAGMNNGVGDAGGGSANTANVANATPSSQLFNRRSTVSLYSQAAGELRLGRDYDPSFWNTVFFDVNGANGIGEGLNLVTGGGIRAGTIARTNNSIGYFLPSNLGGVYGQAQYALGQGNDNNKYWGVRIGYAAGPIDVAYGYGDTTTNTPDDFTMQNIGASWNFGVAKLYGYWTQQKIQNFKEDVWEISVGVPLGQGEFRASYADANRSGTVSAALGGHNFGPDDATLWSLGYVYNLSKRTALYGGYAEISNKGASANSILPGTIAVNLAGHKSSGFNVGVRHSF